MARIIVDHLKYKYPGTDKLALNDISFTVEPGEFIGIIGRNESGKSSLCQAIGGLIPNFYKGAYGGKVLIDGIEVKKVPVDELCETVGIVFQNPFNQVTGAKATVFEEIAFGLENLGIPKAEMIMRIENAMEILDIVGYRDRYPFDLSGGQMQRMAIAGVIAMRPQIMILDEPTSQLDPQGREEVFRAVQKLAKQGITIILAEHNMEKIAQYSDRAILLNDGKLIAVDTPQRIFSREDLEEYGVETPVYTQICRKIGRKNERTGCFPVTLEEAKALLGSAGPDKANVPPESDTANVPPEPDTANVLPGPEGGDRV
ncbi:MAG TPA: ABC transporter ATP-binding protein [Anaerovoracaceae bacterium]|nr:ABC transporter ATP-binding protein [Anaerovoracaceae bacterium]